MESENPPDDQQPVRILGVDPGLNITGYGVLEVSPAGPKLREAGVVRGRNRTSLTDRILEIHTGVAEVIATLRPSAMALEQLSREDAERLRKSGDRAREGYVKHFYNRDPRDPALYHLVIDSTALPVAAVVDVIVAAAAGR